MENAGIRSELSPEEKSLLDKEITRILHEKRCERKGAKVFCISCGAGKRSPLRKWKTNRRTGDAIYICSDCWKIKEQIGEERFEKALMGEET